MRIWYLYAWFFSNLWVYYLYSPGMPLTYILAALFFVASYLVYKWLFFSWYQTSFGFNEDVALYSVGLFKWGLFFHLLMAMMIYSNKRVLPPEGYGPEQYRRRDKSLGELFGGRFASSAGITAAIVFFVVVICYLVWALVIRSILDCLDRAEERRRRAADEEEEEQGGDAEAEKFRSMMAEDASDDFYREVTIKSLKDHYVRANKEYEQFRTMANALVYEEGRLTEHQAKLLKKALKMRIQAIEDAIDIQLNGIGGLEPYLERSYMVKLRALEANGEKVLEKDPRRQRLTDVAQSYNLYDAEEFHRVRQVLDRLDRELLELDYLDKEDLVS